MSGSSFATTRLDRVFCIVDRHRRDIAILKSLGISEAEVLRGIDARHEPALVAELRESNIDAEA